MSARYWASATAILDSRPKAAPPIWLNTEMVNDIHQRGGTLLGFSRGPVSPDSIVDFLEQRGINILFTPRRRRSEVRMRSRKK
jgi:hypothetical protein